MNATLKHAAAERNLFALRTQATLVSMLEAAAAQNIPYVLGREVTKARIATEKEVLRELDRKQQIYESAKYEKLPYLHSNGSAGKENVKRTKAHFSEGNVVFIETKANVKAEGIKRHTASKSHLTKSINKKTSNMATKTKAASKKAATKKANNSKKVVSKGNKAYRPASGTIAEKIRSAYGTKLNPNFDKSAYAQKTGIPYHLIYGCITKYEAKLTEASKGGAKKAK